MENKLNNENYELYIMMYKEGRLDASEAAMVEDALRQNPQWRELADLYDPALKLPADTTLHYPWKEALMDNSALDGATYLPHKVRLQKKKRLRFPVWTAAAAAACIALLIIVSSLRSISQERKAGPLSAEIQIEPKEAPIIMESMDHTTQTTTNTTASIHFEKTLTNTDNMQPGQENEYTTQVAETATDSVAPLDEMHTEEPMESNTYKTTYSNRLIVFVTDSTNETDYTNPTPSETLLSEEAQNAKQTIGTKIDEVAIILRIKTTRLRTNTLTFINYATITTTAILADTRENMEKRMKSLINK